VSGLINVRRDPLASAAWAWPRKVTYDSRPTGCAVPQSQALVHDMQGLSRGRLASRPFIA